MKIVRFVSPRSIKKALILVLLFFVLYKLIQHPLINKYLSSSQLPTPILSPTPKVPTFDEFLAEKNKTASPTYASPSERSLKAAIEFYNLDPNGMKKIYYSADVIKTTKDNDKIECLPLKVVTTMKSCIVQQMAIQMDSDKILLLETEGQIEKINQQKSRPIINYQPPAVIQQQAPVIQQQQTFPKNCTSNTIGNYTYTNCY